MTTDEIRAAVLAHAEANDWDATYSREAMIQTAFIACLSTDTIRRAFNTDVNEIMAIRGRWSSAEGRERVTEILSRITGIKRHAKEPLNRWHHGVPFV